MTEIILWSLLAFFGAFGLVEFIRFVYTDWNTLEENFHVVIQGNKAMDNIEVVVRHAMLATDFGSLIVVIDTATQSTEIVLKKLQENYPHIQIMKTEDYINYLRR